jgi:hypothetical protein
MKINYEDDLRIDEEMLDWEFLEQATRMMKYCTIYAEAIKAESLAKESLDVCRADLDKAIRTAPDTFGINGKLTEEMVKNTIILQADFIASNHAYIEACYEAEMAKGAVRAMDHRKEALENMVKLHGQSYFAGPKVPHNLSETKLKWKKSVLPPVPVITRKR